MPTNKRPKRAKVGTTSILVCDVPPEAKAKFKALCAKRGIPMRTAFMEFILNFGKDTDKAVPTSNAA